MKSLKLGRMTKTLSLLSAGALLGVFLLAPLNVGASHDPGERPIRQAPPTMFVLESTVGQNFRFTLVENGSGEMELVHIPPAPRVFNDNGDDD